MLVMSKETKIENASRPSEGVGRDDEAVRRMSEHLSRAMIELSFACEEAKLAGDTEAYASILLALTAVRSAMD